MITLDELKQIVPHAGARADLYADPLADTMDEFEINSPLRMAAFLATIAHESGSFKYVKELATGGAYEGRADLGNTEPGDGIKYKGRGLIQVTGKANYRECGEDLGLDLVEHPELLEHPENACRSAGWFWHKRGLNAVADREDFKRVTKIVNGGYNGYQDRLKYYEKAKAVLG